MPPVPPEQQGMGFVARRALVTTAVAVVVVAVALALWNLRLIVSLVFVAVTFAAAMRPSVDWLQRRAHVPRALGVLLHYLVVLGLVAAFLSFVVPRLVNEVQAALASAQAHPHATGVKQQILNAIDKRLRHLPSTANLIHPALSAGEAALKVGVEIFFTFATAAYWVFERDRFIDFVTGFVARPKRKKVRDTWQLIDLRLGAFVRGELLLIALVGSVVSTAFFFIGEPYWLLIGIGVALFEVVPIIGPLIAFVLAVGVGLTASWHVAAFAGGVLLVVRLLQDYIVNPRVLGGAVGISPLLVLVAVSVVGVLLGAFYVLIAVPLASLLVTVLDVAIRGVEPGEAEPPTVLFSAHEHEHR